MGQPHPLYDNITCRVLFGSNHLYVFHHPQEVSHFIESGEQPKPVTYDAAQGEIAEGAGFDMKTEGKSKGHFMCLCSLLVQARVHNI